MMKECKHKNIVAYFGSYHRCCVLSAHPHHMCQIPQIVGGLNYVEFDFCFPHTAAGFLSHSFKCFVRLLYACISFRISGSVYWCFLQLLNASMLSSTISAKKNTKIIVVCLPSGTPSFGSAWSTVVEAHCRICIMVYIQINLVFHPILANFC